MEDILLNFYSFYVVGEGSAKKRAFVFKSEYLGIKKKFWA